MAKVSLLGNAMNTIGTLPAKGSIAPDFEATKGDLSTLKLSDLRGKRVVLNIFPSLDTATCAASVRHFNADASKMDNTVVLCISEDLPFAQGRFCTTEGLKNVIPVSLFRSPEFGKAYGTVIVDGPMRGLQSRAVVVVNEEGKVVTNGGRVLGVTALGKDLKEARAKAYEATEWVDFDNKYMRHDIGKAIDEA